MKSCSRGPVLGLSQLGEILVQMRKVSALRISAKCWDNDEGVKGSPGTQVPNGPATGLQMWCNLGSRCNLCSGGGPALTGRVRVSWQDVLAEQDGA